MLGGARGFSVTTLFSICVIDLLLQLSVFFQLAKSVVVPVTSIQHLGFIVDVQHKVLRLTNK